MHVQISGPGAVGMRKKGVEGRATSFRPLRSMESVSRDVWLRTAAASAGAIKTSRSSESSSSELNARPLARRSKLCTWTGHTSRHAGIVLSTSNKWPYGCRALHTDPGCLALRQHSYPL